MEDQFSGPSAGGGGPKITEYDGRLLLITPTEYKTEIPTSFGVKDAVVADIVVLDGDGAPVKNEAMYLFQGKLIGQTKQKVGAGMILGRLGREQSSKPGQSPAWTLADPTEEDKQKARDFLASVDPFA